MRKSGRLPEVGEIWHSRIHRAYIRIDSFEDGLVKFTKDMGVHTGQMSIGLFLTDCALYKMEAP